MANGRFISNSLGDSERFSALTDARYQVAFVLIVTWADAEGRFIADPVTLNGKLFTRLGWTPDVVQAGLEELADVGLVTLYEADGKPYGVVERFHEHNTIRRKEDGSPLREAASKLPPPPEQVRSDRATPAVALPLVAVEPPQSLRSDRAPTAQLLRSPAAHKELEVQVEGEVEVKSMSAHADDPPAFLEILIGTWNEQCGDLRRVRDIPTALKDPNLTRLAAALHRRHAARALEIFTTGIAAVRADPHWLGSKAAKPTRQGAAYGLQNYLRHVETKAEEAADLAASTTRHRSAQRAARPLEDGDIISRPETNEMAVIHEILPGGMARMNNGQIWSLEGCTRCNN